MTAQIIDLASRRIPYSFDDDPAPAEVPLRPTWATALGVALVLTLGAGIWQIGDWAWGLL